MVIPIQDGYSDKKKSNLVRPPPKCKNPEKRKEASCVDAPSDRKRAAHLAARFSFLFFLFSALSFLVKGFFFALRIPTLFAS
jgi:hypothetical protein